MEKTQKRRSSGGFMRSLFKAAGKPNSIARFGSNKIKPSPSEEKGASFGAQPMEHKTTTTTFVKPKNNYGLPDYYYYYDASNYGGNCHRDTNNNNNNNYHYNIGGGGGGGGDDENVDVKAASYISYVRERFKLEKS
ncbi:hypothetical protein L484_017455 [Morus notabilis]|uniref:Uncharacterized protein n=1 Tax=Morus notabilis TaxID=981085 RepID=W9QW79_9ROSA|nr:hypothetical protein L484_017455 [Morus notabilis]